MIRKLSWVLPPLVLAQYPNSIPSLLKRFRKKFDILAKNGTQDTMSSLEIANQKSSEEKVIVWKIPNFTQLHKTQSESCTIERTFTIVECTAGESLGQPSTWALELHFLPGTEQIGFYLRLKKSPVIGKTVNARYTVSVKVTEENSDKLVLTGETEVKDYNDSEVLNAWGYGNFMSMEKLNAHNALLDNDTLTIVVQLVINGDNNATVPVCVQEILKQNAVYQMAKHFGGLLETGEGSDFIIRVKKLDSQEYVEKKVSRIILSSQSSVFETMLGSPMLEKETGVVTIEDLTPKGLDILLQFMYTGNLSSDWKLIPAEIINAAEKYNFVLLKNYIDEWLHTACTEDNAFVLFTLAKKQGLINASKNILEYIKLNLENVLTQTERLITSDCQ